MKALIYTAVIIMISFPCRAQRTDNEIEIKKRKYFRNGELLKTKELKSLLRNNAASSGSFHLYRKNANIATPLLLGGSILALSAGIVSLASSLDEANALEKGQIKDNNSYGLGLALAGLAVAVVSVPFSLAARDHLHNSIDQYNTDIKRVGSIYPPPVRLNLLVKTNGLCIRMTF